jgi:hypothetical protein
MACTKHRLVSGGRDLCPVCLLEQALAPASVRDLIIQVPLGHGHDTSVFLVRQEAPSAALLRLKVWRRRAPAEFLDAVSELTGRLEVEGEAAIVPPLAASLDSAGGPAVLSAFRQGLPILAGVRSGVLDPAAALALLEPMAQTLERCHQSGLAHGSFGPGNVMIAPGGADLFLVDFGLAPLFDRASSVEAAAADRAGLNALAQALRSHRFRPVHVGT